MLAAYSIATFAAAGLLFLIQPMIAREVLPLLGGGPAVWTTCMLFFQCVLLCGYLYAHALTTRLRTATQVGVHASVLLLAWGASAAFGPPDHAPPAGQWPVPWLLWALLASVGPGCFALSTTGPLLQRWFSGTSHPRASRPYFLYSASNAGSLIGLLAYPLAVEPALTLGAQRAAWVVGMAVFASVTLWCGVAALRGTGGALPVSEREPAGCIPRGARCATWASWGVKAFVPSSLMLGVTAHIAMDIASFPLLWTIPLAIYLVSFVLAFGRCGPWLARVLQRLAPVTLIAMVLPYAASAVGFAAPTAALMALHLVGFALIATWCHARLAVQAPEPSRLTEFYLVLAVSGALGGAFNALLAPVLFTFPVEYGVSLAIAGLVVGRSAANGRWAAWAATVPLGATMYMVVLWAAGGADAGRHARMALVMGPPAILALLASRHGVAFALALGVMVAGGAVLGGSLEQRIHARRSFFGTSTVVRTESNGRISHELFHGNTSHGAQSRDPDPQRRLSPLAYYSTEGPAGDVFEALHDRGGPVRTAVIGLGAGAMASYAQAGDTMTFFEIDPAVADIAQDPALFTYLREAQGDVDVVLGDGRRSMDQLPPDTRYDLIVLDAFSSDSVPIHLLTREALKIYFDRLRPGGVVLAHVSNRYLRLDEVVASTAAAAGAGCLARRDDPGTRRLELGHAASHWMALVPPGHPAPRLPPLWQPPEVPPDAPVWSDNFSDLVSIIDWW